MAVNKQVVQALAIKAGRLSQEIEKILRAVHQAVPGEEMAEMWHAQRILYQFKRRNYQEDMERE